MAVAFLAVLTGCGQGDLEVGKEVILNEDATVTTDTNKNIVKDESTTDTQLWTTVENNDVQFQYPAAIFSQPDLFSSRIISLNDKETNVSVVTIDVNTDAREELIENSYNDSEKELITLKNGFKAKYFEVDATGIDRTEDERVSGSIVLLDKTGTHLVSIETGFLQLEEYNELYKDILFEVANTFEFKI